MQQIRITGVTVFVTDVPVRTVVGHPEAKAAMEMTLFDIVGQASGLPVVELLGGRCRDDIPLSFSVADPDFDRDMEMVKRLYGEGPRLFKLKSGFAGDAADLERMERFRKELPADAEPPTVSFSPN